MPQLEALQDRMKLRIFKQSTSHALNNNGGLPMRFRIPPWWMLILSPLHRAADWKAALSWLRWLLDKFGPDPLLLSRIGYVQLALGHVPAAEATFARTAAIAATPAYGTDKTVQAAVRRKQGLLLAANQDYKGEWSPT